jgi:hypothetical protein
MRRVEKVKETNVYQSIIIFTSDDAYIYIWFREKKNMLIVGSFITLSFDA